MDRVPIILSKENYYRIRSVAVVLSWIIWGSGGYLLYSGEIGRTIILFIIAGFVPYLAANILTRYNENT